MFSRARLVQLLDEVLERDKTQYRDGYIDAIRYILDWYDEDE